MTEPESPVGSADVPTVVAEFGTGLQHTRVLRFGTGRLVWQRWPGPDRAGTPGPPAGFAALAAAASSARVRFAVPEPGPHHGYEWSVPSPVSAATLLLSGDDENGVLAGIIGELGARLRALHEQPGGHELDARPNAGELTAPGWPVRLRDWLASGAGPRAATRWHHLLADRLGITRWRRLVDWTEQAVHPERPAVTHGFFTLGGVVLAANPVAAPATVVLSGPEVARAPRELDLGCLLGELAEHTELARRAGVRRAVLPAALRDAFLAGYGTGWDRELAARLGAVRVATHAHDFAAYVGWHDDLTSYAEFLLKLFDSDAAEIFSC